MSKRSQRGKKRLASVQDGRIMPTGMPIEIAGAITQSRTQIEAYSGPIPPPKFLREFDEIAPGSAKTILEVSAEQSRHRMKVEKWAILSSISRQWLGWFSATLLGALGIGGGIWLVYLGHDWAGAAVATGTGGGLATVFITGRQIEKSERVEKSRHMRR